MDSASNPKPGLRQKLIIGAVAAVALLAFLGLSLLQERTATEMQARKNATALAFERAPEQWLGQPREASEFERAVQAREVAAVGVDGPLVLYTDRAGRQFSARLIDCGANCKNEIGSRLGELSVAQGFALTHIDVDARTTGQRVSQALDKGMTLLAPLLTLLLVAGVLVFLHLRGTLGPRTRLAEKPKTRFDDVIGADEAKRALKRVTAFMKDPKQYAAVGAQAPRGVLLDGPAGTGKTLLAKALAGECGAQLHQRGRLLLQLDVLRRRHRQGQGAVQDGPRGSALHHLHRRDRRHRQAQQRQGGRRRCGRAGAEPHHQPPAGGDGRLLVAGERHRHRCHQPRGQTFDEAMRRPGRFDMSVHTALPTAPEREQLYALLPGQGEGGGRHGYGVHRPHLVGHVAGRHRQLREPRSVLCGRSR